MNIRAFLSAIAILLFATAAIAQTAEVPIGPGSNGSAGSGGSTSPGGSNGQLQYNASGSFGGFTLGGDCTFSEPNITCTLINGKTVTLAAAFTTTGSATPTLAFPASGTPTYTFPAASATIPALGTGQTWAGNQNYAAGTAGAPLLTVGNSTTGCYSLSTTGFGCSVNAVGAFDWGISHASGFFSADIYANYAIVGNQSQAPEFFVLGTKPTLTTGSCSGTGAAGGTTGGTFIAAACTGGTYILSGMAATSTGFACTAQDRTTPADTFSETATTTTSVTFQATTLVNDVIQFQCLAY